MTLIKIKKIINYLPVNNQSINQSVKSPQTTDLIKAGCIKDVFDMLRNNIRFGSLYSIYVYFPHSCLKITNTH